MNIFKLTSGINYEVIVVDNGSRDNSVVAMSKFKSQNSKVKLKIILNKKNLGFAKAANIGARIAKGRYLIFLNNDLVVSKNWLLPIISFLKKNKEVVVCQPKIKSYVSKDYFDYTGGGGGFLDMFGYPFTRGRVFDSVEKDTGQYDDTREIVWASGACFVIKRKVFNQMNGYDEFFYAYQEEIDLCIRLKRKGHKIYYIPDVTVYHWGAYTSNRDLPRKIYLNHLNSLYLFIKNYSFWPYFPFYLIRFFFDICSFVYYLYEGRSRFAISLVSSYIKLVKLTPKITKFKTFQEPRSLLNLDNIYKGSIVIDYFLRGRHDFEAIMDMSSSKKKRYKTYREITYFQ